MSIGGIQPEEALELANAIALRESHLKIIYGQIGADLEGTPYTPPDPEQLQKMRLGHTVLYLAKVERPDAPTSWLEEINASFDGEEPWKEANAQGYKTAYKALISEVLDSSGTADDHIDDFAKTLNAAKKVAQAHQVSVAMVYATDELYVEAYRQAFSVHEIADKLSRTIEGISETMLNKVAVQQIENLLPKELLARFSEEKLAEMVLALQLSPDFQASMRKNTEAFKENMRQTGLHLLWSMYGKDALDDLTDAQRSIITPRKPLVAAVLDALHRAQG